MTSLQTETKRIVHARQASQLDDLETFTERSDWLMFWIVLGTGVRTTLQALFAAHGVYYPGDK